MKMLTATAILSMSIAAIGVAAPQVSHATTTAQVAAPPTCGYYVEGGAGKIYNCSTYRRSGIWKWARWPHTTHTVCINPHSSYTIAADSEIAWAYLGGAC